MDVTNLVTDAQAGNKKAFGSLIDKYYKRIYRMAYQYTGCHSEADEVCQETFLKALKNLRKLKKKSSFKQWLFSISSNILRARHKRKQLFGKFLDSTSYTESRVSDQPFEQLSQHETQRMIQQCLQEMPEHIRLVSIMVLMEGVNQKEVASVLKFSESSVSRYLSTGKCLLREKLMKAVQ